MTKLDELFLPKQDFIVCSRDEDNGSVSNWSQVLMSVNKNHVVVVPVNKPHDTD